MNRWFCVGLWAISLVAGDLWADLRIIDTGPDHIRVEYRAVENGEDGAGGTFLVGVPPRGDVHLELIEAVGSAGQSLANRVGEPLVVLEGISMARRQRVA